MLREENSLSREIQATFKSDARRLESRHLLLNRTDGSNHYDRLSAGEKVLALHKTFNHLRKVTEVDIPLYIMLVYTWTSDPICCTITIGCRVSLKVS